MEKEFIEQLLKIIYSNIDNTEVIRHNEYTYTFSQGELSGKKEIARIVEAYGRLALQK